MAKNNKIHQDRDPRNLQITIKKNKEHTLVYIIVKVLKIKAKILKAVKKN